MIDEITGEKSPEIDNLNAICLIFKASDTRCHERAKNILDKLFLLFGEDIKNNIIIIFTFADSPSNIPALNPLKDKNSPFAKTLGNIDNLKYFVFNNAAYFSDDRDNYRNAYDNNMISFGKLLKYIFSLKRISLESTKKLLQIELRLKIKLIFYLEN